MPTLSCAASTSSIGAETKRQESSIRSTAGSVGIPGGDGVRYSPNSPLTSATMPTNGARSTVRSVSACDAWMRASASATWVPAESQLACLADASESARSTASCETKLRALRSRARPASRADAFASSHTSRTCALAVCSCSRDIRSRAVRSSFQSVSSTWPGRTLSPSVTLSRSMRPPAGGASLARRQGMTEPARVFATVVSTRPTSAKATATATGFGRVRYHAAAASKATTISTSARRMASRPDCALRSNAWCVFICRDYAAPEPGLLELVAKCILQRADLGEHEGRYPLILEQVLSHGAPERRIGLTAKQRQLPPSRFHMRLGRAAQPFSELEALAAHAQHERWRRFGERDLSIDVQHSLRR